VRSDDIGLVSSDQSSSSSTMCCIAHRHSLGLPNRIQWDAPRRYRGRQRQVRGEKGFRGMRFGLHSDPWLGASLVTAPVYPSPFVQDTVLVGVECNARRWTRKLSGLLLETNTSHPGRLRRLCMNTPTRLTPSRFPKSHSLVWRIRSAVCHMLAALSRVVSVAMGRHQLPSPE
jgi:hypothetical protein